VGEAHVGRKADPPADVFDKLRRVMLSVATSIDALGVGLSIAVLKLNVLAASLLIGLVSLSLSIIGLLGGSRLGHRFGKNMEVLGGLVLIGIGLRIVITHLMA